MNDSAMDDKLVGRDLEVRVGDADEAEEDFIVIGDDDELEPASADQIRRWSLLIVDDDHEVHATTRFALDDFTFDGCGLRFISAYSAAEARDILVRTPDIAVVLLDVVMETDQAGLDLARTIRRELANPFIRIILRTGQPGQAPERDVLVHFDINDYKDKSELTAQKLFSAVLGAVRAYTQLTALEMNRLGLEKILTASTSLFERRSITEFMDGVVLQIRSLISDAQGALLCAVGERHFSGRIEDVRIVAGDARFPLELGAPISRALPPAICGEIAKAFEEGKSIYGEDRCVIFFKTRDHVASVAYLCGHHTLTELDRRLLEVFCSKIAIGFDNVHLLEQIRHDASHDRLTGLLNRVAFVERLDAALAVPEADLVVALINLDRFRDVNDYLGHEAGDVFLQEIGRRLTALARPEDVVARFGGDEFAIAHLGAGTRGGAASFADRVMAAVTESLVVAGREIVPTLAIGLAPSSEGPPSRRAEDLIAKADRALRGAKRLGGGRHEIFVEGVRVDGEARLLLITQLIHAIRREEFELHYQPIVHSVDGRLAGFEALIRWRHPERGLLAPGAFIAVVETTGLILPIGTWVLEEAARQSAAWRRDYPGSSCLHMSVNVSARQFFNHDLSGQVAGIIAAHGLDPKRLKLEITESLIMTEPDHAAAELARLKTLGVLLSLDDFGTGYSSLSYLDRFPFDTLKIDRSFVSAMLTRQDSMEIVQVICQLAHRLGLDIVAEGVETAAEAVALRDLGCQCCQGYYFSRPVPAAQAERLIAQAFPGSE